MIIICRNCNLPFESSSNQKKYCTKDCYHKYRLRIFERDGVFYRTCTTCKLEKPLVEFAVKRSVCKDCRKNYKKQIKKDRPYVYVPLLETRYEKSKRDAEKRNKNWEITFEQYRQLATSQCYYCNNLTGRRGVGLDRVNSLKGYSIANVVPCCGRCNIIRGDNFSFIEFCRFSNLIKEMDRERYQNKIKEFIYSTDSLEIGDFVLSSGETSSHYFDLSKLMYDSKTLSVISRAIISLVNLDKIDVILGPILGAIPIISSVLFSLGSHNISLRGAIIRKENKEYGKKDLIEGNLQPNDRVLLVDDVTTTGASVLQLVDNLRENGFTVEKVITILDRQAGAAELFLSNSIPFKSILTVDQIL